jgi:hypothetical protein
MHVTNLGLVREIREMLAIDDLDADENGLLMLKLDEQIVVVELEPEPSVVVRLPLGPMPDSSEDAEVVLRTVMVGHLGWSATEGATIGLDPDSDSLIMAKRIPTHDLNGAQLLDQIALLTDVATRWTSFIANPNQQWNEAEIADIADSEIPLDHRVFI